ncbi:neuropeptide Y receptor type 2 isoform X1 [Nilaparvata lugens]|uniref:neuropeptide Y receptor type 2 isoform X1 n=1 Tax=Nilaparvata lugens TaxID=108931 RepID=UPI00193D539B|nr:neuropeptide Y receptor type 2 isoform X1 [Nilaparvata lugens]XP_039283395.1 neuropeptide Y receptor type 2 isoform X1 [Nilaparvata lugens]XP_039283396.1 neuropeptide Y receptor type 2 isoform X1 [Nilaparvata lugens]
MTTTSLPNNFRVPDAYHDAVFNFLLGFRNGTVDFQRGHLRLSTSRFCNPLVFAYCALITAGLISALGLLHCLLKADAPRPLFTWHFANLAVCDVFKCAVVLPVTLVNILYHNWRLGQIVCYLFPMMQEIPLHVSGWTFYFIPVQHYQFLQDPGKALQTLKPKVLIIWLISFLMVLPYAYYTLYIDLGSVLNHQFQGTGICGTTGKGKVYEYLRGIFVILCLLPLILSFKKFKKVDEQLQILELSRVDTSYVVKTPSSTKQSRWFECLESLESPSKIVIQRTFLDIRKERLSHKYFELMLISHAVSLVPLLCFRMYLIFTDQTSLENHWIIFGITTWIAFLPTCTTSLLYASWQLSI